MAWPDGFDCLDCGRTVRACSDAPCEAQADWLRQEEGVAEFENHPRMADPVAWASENRYDPEAQADLALHDALHPFGYGADA